MTDLILMQLRSGVLMTYCGLSCGMVYQLFQQLGGLGAKSKVKAAVLEMVSLIFSGYCITAFLYWSSWGKIMPQDVVCFFGGLWIWRKLYGEKGESSPGVREEPPGAEYQQRTGRTKKEKRT